MVSFTKTQPITLHIVIAEDEAFQRATIHETVNRALLLLKTKDGIEIRAVVYECENGQLALEKIKELRSHGHRVSLLLTDYEMPEMDGFSLVNNTAIKHDKNCQVIMISAIPNESAEHNKVAQLENDEALASHFEFHGKGDGFSFRHLKEVLRASSEARLDTSPRGHSSRF